MTAPSPVGLRRFAGYAMAPNERGYCGPDDPELLRAYLRNGSADDGLAALARAFDGPLPYLQIIADATGIAEVFDPRVVEAYWLGNDLLDAVDPHVCAEALLVAFAGEPTVDPRRIVATRNGASPHHGYHVLVTYPWIDFVAKGHDSALDLLDSCRIRWGTVTAIDGTDVTVECPPLEVGGAGIRLGKPRNEIVHPLPRPDASAVQLGDQVSLHWDHLCDHLTAEEVERLRDRTVAVIKLVNRCLLDT